MAEKLNFFGGGIVGKEEMWDACCRQFCTAGKKIKLSMASTQIMGLVLVANGPFVIVMEAH